jgi:hypothetical protein
MVAIALLTGTLIAQEDGGQTGERTINEIVADILGSDEGNDQGVEVDVPGIGLIQLPPPKTVKVGLGNLLIDGRIMTGLRSQMTDQEGLAGSGNWSFEAINAMWQENRVEMNLDYKLLNYGAFVMLQARNWGSNAFNATSPTDLVRVRFGLVYATFLEEKIKFSVGKLYDDIYQKQEKVWKTEGEDGGFRFSDEDRFSMRIEARPIKGLNAGGQFFFVNTDKDAMTGIPAKSIGDTRAWKEFGLGASYKNSMFSAQAGIRFDSDVDGMDRTESKTYLAPYYGDGNFMGTAVSQMTLGALSGPKYKHKTEIGSTIFNGSSPEFTANPYDAGHWAFLGFKLTAVKDLTVSAHGALYNLGAFDKFGYGKFVEYVKYNNFIPGFSGFGAGLTLFQEFYGGDVFGDWQAPGMAAASHLKNSPFFRFSPVVTYKPFMYLDIALSGQIGICPDVLDSYWQIKPEISIGPGIDIFSVKVFYEILHQSYADEEIAGKPSTRHTFGVAVDIIF